MLSVTFSNLALEWIHATTHESLVSKEVKFVKIYSDAIDAINFDLLFPKYNDERRLTGTLPQGEQSKYFQWKSCLLTENI